MKRIAVTAVVEIATAVAADLAVAAEAVETFVQVVIGEEPLVVAAVDRKVAVVVASVVMTVVDHVVSVVVDVTVTAALHSVNGRNCQRTLPY